MRKTLRYVLPLLLLLSVGYAANAQQGYVPVYFPGDCPFPPPEFGIECGTLTVPEDRSNPDGPKVFLTVLIIPAANLDPLPDPIFYLEGGPGGSALFGIDNWIRSTLRQNRDFVLIDPRGTGFSQPSLNCPELEVIVDTFFLIDPIEACRERLAEDDVNLSAYNSEEMAADINDLRIALGYEQINLYGISYGTRVGLTVLRDYPGTVRSVVLDSVLPPNVNWLEGTAQAQIEAFDALFGACEADRECNAAFPNLESRFLALVERYNANPQRLTYRAPTGFPIVITMDGDDIAWGLFQGMYNTRSLSLLPLGLDILDFAETDEDFEIGLNMIHGFYTPQMILEGFRFDLYTDALQSPAVFDYIDEYGDVSFAEGVYYSVDCREEYVFNDPAIAAAGAASAPEPLQQYFVRNVEFRVQGCGMWGVLPADPVETAAVVSDVPTLLLSGRYDPVTPSRWGDVAAQTLLNSQHVVFPHAGHGVSTVDSCAIGLVEMFVNTATLPLDASCSTIDQNLRFFIPAF